MDLLFQIVFPQSQLNIRRVAETLLWPDIEREIGISRTTLKSLRLVRLYVEQAYWLIWLKIRSQEEKSVVYTLYTGIYRVKYRKADKRTYVYSYIESVPTLLLVPILSRENYSFNQRKTSERQTKRRHLTFVDVYGEWKKIMPWPMMLMISFASFSTLAFTQ